MTWLEVAGLRSQAFLASRERAAVLLTHGYAEHMGRYRELTARLNLAGYSVYAYDQRGHGQSSGRRAVVDARQLLTEHLRARERLRTPSVPLFAFGHSLGGLITAASALQDPRGLSGVVLSSPALLVGEKEPPLLRALSEPLARLFPALPVTRLAAEGISRLPREVERYQKDEAVYHGRVPALTAASMLRLSGRVRRELGAWRLPTLLLHGDADALAAVEGSRLFAAHAGEQRAQRPDVTYVEVAGGYHELFNDSAKEEVTARLLSWLDERTRSEKP